MTLLNRLCDFYATYVLKRPKLAKRISFYVPDWMTAIRSVLNELSYRMKRDKSFKVTTVVVELSALCNLNCTICARHDVMSRQQGNMSMETFKKIVDMNPSVNNYVLVGWGEMMLNPIFFEAVSYLNALGKKIALTSNATLFTADNVARILDGGITHITISMDGIDGVYEAIRGYPFAKIEDNLRTLAQAIKARKVPVYTEINAVGLPDVLAQKAEIATRIGPLVDDIRFSSYLEYNKKFKTNRDQPCRELWRGMISVLYDGRVVPCCMDYNATMVLGDVHEASLDALWNNQVAKKYRAEHLQCKFLRRCATCYEDDPSHTGEVEKRFG